jgi:WD40 repeat protein
LGSLFSRQYLFQLPLWFAEGYAEYSSRHGWDIQGDMVLRDATINGYLTPLEYAGGFLVYKEGQSAIGYIVDKFGQEKLSEILNRGKSELSMDRALKSAIGMDQKSFSEEWEKAERKRYWPDIALRKEAKDFAKQLTDHSKDGSYINEKPAFSPGGDQLAIFSDRSDYTAIYIISAIDGKVLKRLVRGERSGDLESLHSYVSGLSWSPDGKNIAFVSKSRGQDVLCLVRVRDGKIYQRFRFGLDAMRSPSWSSDGYSVALVGVKDGMADLYVCDVRDGKLTRLTEDRYDDEDPSFSPDGGRLAFSSDRPLSPREDSSGFKYGRYNLYVMEMDSKEMTALTHGEGGNTSPTWAPKGDKICFVSDRNGIYNLYLVDLDSSATFPITNCLSGCFSPSWSSEGDKIAFSGFQMAGWDIFVMKELKPAGETGDSLTMTSYLLSLSQDTVVAVADTQKVEEETEEPPSDFSSYVFKAGKSELDSLSEVVNAAPGMEEQKEKKDTLSYRLANGDYRQRKYRLKFSPDLVSGALSYDTFFGFQGQSLIAISDMMGNHTFILATDVVNTIDQSNFQIFYLYGGRRLNVGAGILHTKYYYIDDIDRLFSDRVYGALAYFALPLLDQRYGNLGTYRTDKRRQKHLLLRIRALSDPPEPDLRGGHGRLPEVFSLREKIRFRISHYRRILTRRQQEDVLPGRTVELDRPQPGPGPRHLRHQQSILRQHRHAASGIQILRRQRHPVFPHQPRAALSLRGSFDHEVPPAHDSPLHQRCHILRHGGGLEREQTVQGRNHKGRNPASGHKSRIRSGRQNQPGLFGLKI